MAALIEDVLFATTLLIDCSARQFSRACPSLPPTLAASEVGIARSFLTPPPAPTWQIAFKKERDKESRPEAVIPRPPFPPERSFFRLLFPAKHSEPPLVPHLQPCDVNFCQRLMALCHGAIG